MPALRSLEHRFWKEAGKKVEREKGGGKGRKKTFSHNARFAADYKNFFLSSNWLSVSLDRLWFYAFYADCRAWFTRTSSSFLQHTCSRRPPLRIVDCRSSSLPFIGHHSHLATTIQSSPLIRHALLCPCWARSLRINWRLIKQTFFQANHIRRSTWITFDSSNTTSEHERCPFVVLHWSFVVAFVFVFTVRDNYECKCFSTKPRSANKQTISFIVFALLSLHRLCSLFVSPTLIIINYESSLGQQTTFVFVLHVGLARHAMNSVAISIPIYFSNRIVKRFDCRPDPSRFKKKNFFNQQTNGSCFVWFGRRPNCLGRIGRNKYIAQLSTHSAQCLIEYLLPFNQTLLHALVPYASQRCHNR